MILFKKSGGVSFFVVRIRASHIWCTFFILTGLRFCVNLLWLLLNTSVFRGNFENVMFYCRASIATIELVGTFEKIAKAKFFEVSVSSAQFV